VLGEAVMHGKQRLAGWTGRDLPPELAAILAEWVERDLPPELAAILVEGLTFPDRAATYHQLVRLVSNLVLQLPHHTARESRLVSLRHNSRARADVTTMISLLVDLFSTFVPPGAKVFASLREQRVDGRFETIIREGRFAAERESRSKALHITEDATIRRLTFALEQGRNVLLTGSTRSELEWTRQPNDVYGEDRSVLMGGVLIKTWSGQDFRPPSMVWVVTVCCDQENAFNDRHVSLMQSCVDLLSIVANVVARSDNDGDGALDVYRRA
jgi:hypothetical protein